MIPLKRLTIILLLLIIPLLGAEKDDGLEGVKEFPTPDASATIALGFNYDYLRSPLATSFDKSRGYFSVNIPFAFKPSQALTDDLTSDISKNFTDGELFEPELTFKQNANTTIMVELPMLGGATSFSHLNMMQFSYENLIGLPNFLYTPDSLDGSGDTEVDLLLRGAINVPFSFNMSWETMNFGYLYKFNDQAKVGLNLHHHLFFFDASGNVDIDMLGNLEVDLGAAGVKEINMDYSLYNNVDANYRLQWVTPTFSAQVWRFSTIARIGFDQEATGSLNGEYTVPFFLDPTNFSPVDSMADSATFKEYLTDHISDFEDSKTKTVRYNTTNNLQFTMPTGLTFGFDLVPEKLNLSYTKLLGDISWELVDYKWEEIEGEDEVDTLDFRIAVNVDHVVVLRGHFPNIFFSLGLFSMDVSYRNDEDLLQDIDGMISYGDGILMPITNFGVLLGKNNFNCWQVLFEVDALPLASFRTGVVYHF